MVFDNKFVHLVSISIDHCLRHPLPLVIASPRTNGVNISPVGLVLWVYGRIAIDLRRRSMFSVPMVFVLIVLMGLYMYLTGEAGEARW